MKTRVSAILLVGPLLCACDQQPQNHGEDNVRIQKLEATVSGLSATVATHDTDIASLKYKESLDDFRLNLLDDRAAYLDTSSKNYAIARNQYGFFPTYVEKVEPYLDGYKITAGIINPYDLTFTGPTVKLGWGPYGIGSKMEFKPATEFLAGRATIVELTATPAKPSDVKHLTIGIDFTGMQYGVPANLP